MPIMTCPVYRDTVDAAVALLRQQWPPRKVARVLNISQSTVYKLQGELASVAEKIVHEIKLERDLRAAMEADRG